MTIPRSAVATLMVAGLMTGQNTEAAPRSKPAPATPAPPPVPIVVKGGQAAGQMTPEQARKEGLTVVDLSDEWLPYVFSEEPDKPQPMRSTLIALANGRFRGPRARADRYFEVFGISPTLNLVRRRLAEAKRHACHARVKDGVLEELSAKNVIPAEVAEKMPNPNTEAVAAGDEPAMIPTGRTISPRPLKPLEKKAVVAMQAHLRCEGVLPGRANRGRMDRRTVEGLRAYQRLQTLADSGNIDPETRAALLGDSREQDFRALLRALRERVVDATGLIEDGSAMGILGEVQGRLLDTAEFSPLPARPAADPSAPAAPTNKPPVDPSAKIVPAPDLIAAATQAASQALGWTSPEAVLASPLVVEPAPTGRPARKGARKGPLPLPALVAIRLPPLPSYHGPKMELRAEIDRGQVVLKRPKLDKDGRKRWTPPVADRATLTLYARDKDREVALCRWPTTIGGWKTFEKSDGTKALKYKESVTGDALWPAVLATPTWHPAPGMPIRRLLVKQGDGFAPKTEIIGPGYHAAYGLVALVHHQIMGVNEKGEQQLMDLRIRTHGTPGYRSVKRGESNGCHRLHNFEALRLASFIVKHHPNVREGLVPEDYVRHVTYKGQDVALESDSKGYRFKLTPPVPVKVLEGDVQGNSRATKYMVPLSAVP